jgi:hypothetical protein
MTKKDKNKKIKANNNNINNRHANKQKASKLIKELIQVIFSNHFFNPSLFNQFFDYFESTS